MARHMWRSRYARGLLAWLVLLLLAAVRGVSAGQLVVQQPGDRVSLRVENAPLGLLLREFKALTPIELKMDAAVEGRPVTVTLENVPIEWAVNKVLTESGVNFVAAGLQRASAQLPIRLIVGDPTRTVLVDEGNRLSDKEAPRSDLAAPPPEPPLTPAAREEDKPANQTSASNGAPDPAASQGSTGNTTSPGLLSILTPPPAAGAAGGMVMLPFPGENGKPMEVSAAPGTRRPASPGGLIMLPFVNPDGSPMMVPALAPSPAPAVRQPGIVPSPPKPPGT